MSTHPKAGKQPEASDLVDLEHLASAYYASHGETNGEKRVDFGTSGHRGSSLLGSFTEAHIEAICQALVMYRQEYGIDGPLFIGMDTHALSLCAWQTAIGVLVANNVSVVVQKDQGFTPTPVISHKILSYNHGRTENIADGIVITPSHNPPEDGGFKYNPPNGGPADTGVTNFIQEHANHLLAENNTGVKKLPFEEAWVSSLCEEQDFVEAYVQDLSSVIDMQAIINTGVKIGVDPLGGSALAYWSVIAEYYGLDLEVVNDVIDPQFAFMPLDKDGKIRMDCSSHYAMSGLVGIKENYQIAIANDPDSDRHGIVTRSTGLMNPNHYLAVAIHYLYTHRPDWSSELRIGKTLVSSSLIDRVAESLQREVVEVPVGFKWFVDGLHDEVMGFAGEESAGASLLCRDGSVWSTDKDGIVLGLLAAEIMAVTGKDPGEYYAMLIAELGEPLYRRIDAPANREQRELLKRLNADDFTLDMLAGEAVVSVLTHAPGNNAPIGGLKVVAKNGWFAARPSGTEDIYKIYAESFLGEKHLAAIFSEAQSIIDHVMDVA